MFKIILALICTYSSFAESINDKVKKSLASTSVKKALINEMVVISPIKDHHFNLEAPQECGNTDSTIDLSTRQISCQFHSSGKKSILVSVCDDTKSYCKQEKLSIEVGQKKSSTARIEVEPLRKTRDFQNKNKKLLMKNFKTLSPEAVKKELSKGEKKGAIIMVSTDWCPPCNAAKEFLLPTKDFDDLTKDILLVYVDGDNTNEINKWRPVLNTKFYPSFVFMNKEMKRVDVLTGYVQIKKFSNWVKSSLLNVNDSIEELEERVLARANGSFIRKVLDLVYSKAEVLEEETKWLSLLRGLGRMNTKIQYMESKKELKNSIEFTEDLYTAAFMGAIFKDLDPEKKAEKMESLEDKLFNTVNKDSEVSAIYSYVIDKKCSEGAIKEDEDLKVKCIKKYSEIVKSNEKWMSENKDNYTESEVLIKETGYLRKKATLFKLNGETAQSEQELSSCIDNTEKLMKLSPLKEKSRYVRLLKIPCFKIEDSQNLATLESLVKDYPYEATFYTRIVEYYLKIQDYNKALSYSEKAIKYAYGDSWIFSLKLQATILERKGNFLKAYELIEMALSEIKLNKESRAIRLVKELRSMQSKLRAKISNKKIASN